MTGKCPENVEGIYRGLDRGSIYRQKRRKLAGMSPQPMEKRATGLGFLHQFTGKNFSKLSYFDAEGAFEPATNADISRNPSLFLSTT